MSSITAALIVASSTSAPTAGALGPDAAPGALPASLNAVYVVMDTSGSMGDRDAAGTVKVEGAKKAVLNYLDGVDTGTAIGLRTYPADGSSSCNAGTLRYPLERHEPSEVAAVVRSLTADGNTPTAEALRQAADDIRKSGYAGATIVLMSDGESTCDDPCVAAQEIVNSGLQVQVISVGFVLSDAGREELQCIASTTGGKYVDVEDSDQLNEIFRDLAVPRLAVSLSHPSRVVAEAGLGPNGVVTISAVVTNVSQVIAQNVQLRVQFETPNPGVIAPVRALGNLVAGTSASEMRWTFRPGFELAGTTVRFSVVARAQNMPVDVGAKGSIEVVDTTTAAEAGPGVFGTRVVVMGDSYSAGEGTRKYISGTDTETNRCHRSLVTHTAVAFNVDSTRILACSGAVTNDFFNTNGEGVPSQLRQLDDLQDSSGPVDSVVLTIGGNDAGFPEVVTSCLLSTNACDRRLGGKTSEEYLTSKMALLRSRLVDTYLGIHQILNSAEMVAQRGGMAPIYVLGYPRPVPTIKTFCSRIGDFNYRGRLIELFTAAELAFGVRFLSALNGEVEGAVTAARLSRNKVPVFYVPLTEEAFMPNHMICSETPYAQDVYKAFLPASVKIDVTLEEFLLALVAPTLSGLVISGDDVWDAFSRGKNEVMHPNELGYRAMTNALIRWSNSGDAAGVRGFLDSVPQPPPLGTCPPGTDPTPLDPSSGVLGVLRSCLPYELRVEGFRPGATVTVSVNSDPVVLAVVDADSSGAVLARATLPLSLPPGDHHLVAEGEGADGEYLMVSLPFTVEPPGGPLLPWFLGIGGAALAVAGLVMRRLGRRSEQGT